VLRIEPDGDQLLGCQRCEAQIEFPDPYPAGWLFRHAWEDCAPVVVCLTASGLTSAESWPTFRMAKGSGSPNYALLRKWAPHDLQ